MPTNNEVGTKIRCLREMRNVSLSELSQRSGMSVDEIRAIEGGQIATSLTPLLKLAKGLGVRLGTFLDDFDILGPVISKPDSRNLSVHFAGNADKDGLEFHPLAANKHDRNMEPFIIDVNPLKSQDYELSGHEGEEFMYVLSGTLEVVYGNEKYTVNQGESIYYDSIVPHHVHAQGNEVTTILAVVYCPH